MPAAVTMNARSNICPPQLPKQPREGYVDRKPTGPRRLRASGCPIPHSATPART